MGQLQLRVLGDLEVVRDGVALDLPPSRKTRGLLAYLALSERKQRREHLCELLWEIPDDPRGSLRWSLSKIRKLVDDPDQPRIVADRSNVEFDTSAVDIDLHRLHDAAQNGLQALSTEALREAADGYRGSFLQGLELPDFHDYYIWCIGERERASRSQAALLRGLMERLVDAPEQALDCANRLVTLMPFDEDARATLIGLLRQLDRKQEAEQQYRLGMQKFAESGGEDSGALARALREGPRRAAAQATAPQSDEGATSPATPNPTPRLTTMAAQPRDKTLIGREGELALLASLIEGLPVMDSVQVLLIRGESGMGKSRLLQAAAAMAREAGAGLLKAKAFESEMIRPFAVWNDALRRAMPDNPTSQLLGSGERVTRDQVFGSLCDVLREQATERPVVVLCDDVQWSDESSVSAMHHVLNMHKRLPLLIIAASREIELRQNEPAQKVLASLRHDGLLREIRLEPLSAGQLEELIQQNAPGANAERLSQDCGGNPLLALELARAEEEGGSSHSLGEMMRERLARLDEDSESVLLWAAVLAPRITVNSLEQVTNLDRGAVEAALEAAEQQGVLIPGERGLRFSHDLVAGSIYGQIPRSRLQAMHRRAAELLEEATARDLELAADLAHHAARSGDPALAGRAMVSAGKLCLRFYANQDAVELYLRGMEFASSLGDSERVCLTLELCDVRLNAAPLDDWQGAIDEYVDLAERALDVGALAHARLGYQMASYVRWLHGQWSDARRDSLQAERVSRAASDEAHIMGMAEAAKCLAMLERDLSQADAMAMEAGALAERSKIQCAALPTSMGLLRYYEGRLDDAVDYLEDARTLCKAQGDRMSEYLCNEYLTVIEVERDDYSAAMGRCEVLLDMGSRLREGSEYPFAVAMQTLCRYGLGEGDEGLDDALEQLRMADAKQRLTYLLNRAARLDIRHDSTARAHQRAGEALQLAELMERPTETLMAHINLALIHRLNNELTSYPHVKTIEGLSAGPVAAWAREQAAAVLVNHE
jgi:DNA-binding SARP family transcriptional activator